MAHDKFKTCKGCPDRCIEPNCHDGCEGYKTRQEKNAKIKAEKIKDSEFKAMKIGVMDKTKRRAKHGGLPNHLRSKR